MLCVPAADAVEANLAQIGRLADGGLRDRPHGHPAHRLPRRLPGGLRGVAFAGGRRRSLQRAHRDRSGRRGAAKLRINPGNIGGLPACDPIIDAAGEAGIPIRIGVNAGSLDDELAARTDLTQPEKLVESAAGYAAYFADRGFHDLVISTKASDVPTTVAAYRLMAKRLPQVPLHIGVTEAGTLFQGLVKSSAGLGILLEEGIGDTMRISLTDDPVQEVRACWTLLSALGLRRRGPEIVSCPTCGRCQVGLIDLAKQVDDELQSVKKPVKVAVMGCVVNGPGEAADADIGVACGNGSGVIFKDGQTLRKVDEASIVSALMEEIERL
jgi:(E)-4-hydroxy-3-methylbut-2-enyl-diphosphate synthase